MTDEGKTYFFVEGFKCPECGSNLVSEGQIVWCSLGGCPYGVRKPHIKLEELLK